MDDLLKERRITPLRARFVIWLERSVRVLVRAHLAEQAAMLSEVEAVVCGENNNRLVRQSHVFNRLKQKAQPGIHHRDFTAVGGVPLSHLRLFVPGHVMPIAVEREHQFAVVFRQVEFRVI